MWHFGMNTGTRAFIVHIVRVRTIRYLFIPVDLTMNDGEQPFSEAYLLRVAVCVCSRINSSIKHRISRNIS